MSFILSVMIMPAEVLVSKDFEKDLKKMRIRSIWNDTEIFKKAVAQEPGTLRGSFRIPGLKDTDVPVFKFKKFRCRDIGRGTRNIIRLVYAFFESENKILLIEIYKKSQQSNHCEQRIMKGIREYQEEMSKRTENAKAFM